MTVAGAREAELNYSVDTPVMDRKVAMIERDDGLQVGRNIITPSVYFSLINSKIRHARQTLRKKMMGIG